MDITNATLRKILKEISELEVVGAADIPEIDLYMDQLTTFMENKLRKYKRSGEDKIITKTMINNYTKNKVLPVPNKKKYDMNQITMLIMIYHMKQILSLNDISRLLQNVETQKPTKFFEAFAGLQEDNKAGIEADVADRLEKIMAAGVPEGDEKTAMLLLAFSLILEAETNKMIVEKIIDSL